MRERKEKDSGRLRFFSRNSAIAALAGFAVFAVISYLVVTREVILFDTVVREFIYSLRGSGLTVLFRSITFLGNEQTITLLCLLLLLIPSTRLSYGLPLSAAALTAAGLQHVLKVSFHRARPDLSLHLIDQGGYSFPSGHSFTVLIFYGMMIFLCRQRIENKRTTGLVTALLSCLIPAIGFSRIYLGVHYPTDVLGGWSLGICVLMFMISAFLFFQEKESRGRI